MSRVWIVISLLAIPLPVRAAASSPVTTEPCTSVRRKSRPAWGRPKVSGTKYSPFTHKRFLTPFLHSSGNSSSHIRLYGIMEA